MGEVYNTREGTLSFVVASASASALPNGVLIPQWGTAATPVSGIYAFVRSLTLTSGRTVAQIMDRGYPTHHKVVNEQAVQAQITYAWTGIHPTAVAGNGQSVPAIHLELKYLNVVNATAYFQLINAVSTTQAFTQGDEENTLQETFVALRVNGPTGSGYIR